MSKDDVKAARAGEASDPTDHAVAVLASQLVKERGVVLDSALSEVRAAGLDDGLIIEVIANVGLNILTNYTNHAAGTDVDFPIVYLSL